MSSPRSRPGLLTHLPGWLSAVAQYFSARSRLLAIEAKEAGLHLGVAAGLIIAAVCVIVIGYVFLTITVLFAIASTGDSQNAWIWILIGASLFHFAGAAGFAFLAYSRISTALFTETRSELRNDSLWLHPLTKTP